MINTKSRFLIIVAISALVVAVIYSSSVSVVIAETVRTCVSTGKNTAFCTTYNTVTTGAKAYNCTYNPPQKTGVDSTSGGGWSCTQLAPAPPSPDLKDAIVKASKHIATAGGGNNSGISNGSNETSGNNTEGKIMTLRPPLLKQGLLGNNTQP